MTVDDGMNIVPRLVDLTVYEALEGEGISALSDRIAVQIEFQDVTRRHEPRGPGACHQEAIRIGRMPDAHVSRFVEYALARQDAVGGDEIRDRVRCPFAG